MRVDKYISELGVASRKEAAKVAKSGGVLVDGKPVRDLSLHIDPERQSVTYLGRELSYSKFTYVMLNKPALICQLFTDAIETNLIQLI